MKKTIACLLALIIFAGVLVSCAGGDEDKGATIPIYISSEIRDFDPANAMTDEASAKVLSLVFEGLVTVNGSGNPEPAAAESWTYKEDTLNGTYVLTMKLRHSAWSDGRQVSADDFVYAWKRIMEPEFHSEGCALLYQIKNAKAVKAGDVSIDDLGVYAADTQVLEIEFEEDVDVNKFLRNCASPYLFPLREDSVDKCEDWATNISSIVTNGPFTLRSIEIGKQLVLERNIYYRRDVENDSVKKYVKPYRLSINFKSSPDKQVEAFEDGSVFYVGELPLSKREEYANKVKMTDSMSTHTYIFNTNKAPFNDANVRKGLSLAISREEIAKIVVYAESATGIVNGKGIFEDSPSKSFASVSGTLISPTADLETAKSLVKGASVKSFTITIRPDEVDEAVAEYCKGVWSSLGFDVTIEKLESKKWTTPNEYDVYDNVFMDKYFSGEFDVMAVDLVAPSNNPETLLAMFAKQYSGSGKNLAEKQFDDVPHISGYDSTAYNTLIEEALTASSTGDMLAKLHEAEKVLVEDMPIMPIFLYKNAYIINTSKISGVSETPWRGATNFISCNYADYLKDSAAASEAEGASEDE